MKKIGRPKKDSPSADSRQAIIDAAVAIITRDGADAMTVRSVCDEADVSIGTFYHYFQNKDDLMMVFIRDTSFSEPPLSCHQEDVADRITELYMRLIDRYRSLGPEFMKSFYTTGNTALSAYMGQVNGGFADGTVMALCEQELTEAKEAGYLPDSVDPHTASEDVCTIIKGCVFEWCLCDGQTDIEAMLRRILSRYFSKSLQAADSVRHLT